MFVIRVEVLLFGASFFWGDFWIYGFREGRRVTTGKVLNYGVALPKGIEYWRDLWLALLERKYLCRRFFHHI